MLALPHLLPRPLRHLLGRYTVADLIEHFAGTLSDRNLCQHTRNCYQYDLQRIAATFGTMRAAALRPHHIAAWLRQIHHSGAQATAQTLRYRLNAIYVEAIAAGLADANPLIYVAAPRVTIKRQRMTLAQWHAIHQAGQAILPTWWAHAWVLALVSGQRCSDLVTMRYQDIRDGHLYIEQYKTGERIALPLALRLDAVGISLQEAIDATRHYAPQGEYLLRSPQGGRNISPRTLTRRSNTARHAAGITADPGRTPPSLHEVRSLAERLYRAQGIDTMTLLGHRNQRMTDTYNSRRGLTDDTWRVLRLP